MQLHRKAAEERLSGNTGGMSFLARQRQASSRRSTPNRTQQTNAVSSRSVWLLGNRHDFRHGNDWCWRTRENSQSRPSVTRLMTYLCFNQQLEINSMHSLHEKGTLLDSSSMWCDVLSLQVIYQTRKTFTTFANTEKTV